MYGTAKKTHEVYLNTPYIRKSVRYSAINKCWGDTIVNLIVELFGDFR